MNLLNGLTRPLSTDDDHEFRVWLIDMEFTDDAVPPEAARLLVRDAIPLYPIAVIGFLHSDYVQN